MTYVLYVYSRMYFIFYMTWLNQTAKRGSFSQMVPNAESSEGIAHSEKWHSICLS